MRKSIFNFNSIRNFSSLSLHHNSLNILASILLVVTLNTASSFEESRANLVHVRINSASYTRDRLSIQFSCITSMPEIKRPIITIFLLRESKGGALSVNVFIMTSVPDVFWHTGYSQFNSLRKTAGLISIEPPQNSEQLNSLLSLASRNTLKISSKLMQRCQISGSPTVGEGDTLGIHVDLWLDGEIRATFHKDDNTILLRRNIPNDWYIYGKYPDRFLYTSFDNDAYGAIRLNATP